MRALLELLRGAYLERRFQRRLRRAVDGPPEPLGPGGPCGALSDGSSYRPKDLEQWPYACSRMWGHPVDYHAAVLDGQVLARWPVAGPWPGDPR